MKQAKAFLEGEGDNWFQRNKDALGARSAFYETETIKRVLGPHRARIKAVLEIGCGNGAKLRDICRFFGAGGCGLDPSAEAIADGKKAGGEDIAFHVATAAELPLPAASFDLVCFGFCLYLVDRDDIFRAVAEADRVLKSGGFLVIVDFDPARRHKRPYHHKPGLFSYKTSYADFFTAGGHYYLVAKDSFAHGGDGFALDSDERISVSVLYKEIDAY
jgi:ubiquinone/menaquinone biosynthesis C-methylase UbiE